MKILKDEELFNEQGLHILNDKGIAIKKGRPIIVPRGSVAGEGNLLTQTQDVLRNAAAVWRKRLGALGMFGR
jgi:hypothetical protein